MLKARPSQGAGRNSFCFSAECRKCSCMRFDRTVYWHLYLHILHLNTCTFSFRERENEQRRDWFNLTFLLISQWRFDVDLLPFPGLFVCYQHSRCIGFDRFGKPFRVFCLQWEILVQVSSEYLWASNQCISRPLKRNKRTHCEHRCCFCGQRCPLVRVILMTLKCSNGLSLIAQLLG